MEIKLAEKAGFCFGVNRAIEMADALLNLETRPVYTLGEIVHNPQIVASMKARGAQIIDHVFAQHQDGVVFIRSHGVEKKEYEQLAAIGQEYLDATCPCVEKIHKLVREAEQAAAYVFVIGDRAHPEVKGIASFSSRISVFKNEDELKAFSQNHLEMKDISIIMVAQTTQKKDIWLKCVQFAKKTYTNLSIFDTICYATSERQDQAVSLARQSDVMIVVGGKNSSNTCNLAALCQEICPETHHIQCAQELVSIPFSKNQRIGITAGASTPATVIEEVVKTMTDLNNEIMGNDEVNFAEEFEKSFKMLTAGDRVVATVAAVYPNEIQVDLGTKQSGYVALSEFTDDSSARLEDLVKVGDEIELVVTRVNDVEGMISLSKRRIDALKSWDDIENGPKDDTVFAGKVTEAVRGGLIVNSKGVRVFIPASQVTGNRGADLEEFVGKDVKFKILETDRRRKRAIGSIRVIAKAERAAAEEHFFETAEIGKRYTGVVKSLTSYGAFVDLGGIDGMIHITELSWSRIKHPSEVVNVGDTVDVVINDIDREKKRISLGYKSLTPNPWDRFVESYHVGDVVNVTIVKMMPFGAFAQIIPGVDGLIHISQIADRRIAKPQDVLTAGEKVDVMITELDLEKKKISLSIRALPESADASAEKVPAEDIPAATEE